MKKCFIILIIVLTWSMLLLASGSISTSFVEVLIENLMPGNSYSLKQTVNYPYKIINKGDNEIELKVNAKISDKNYLRKKFENIPDTSWIKFNPEKLNLKPGEEGIADIIITIPNKKEYFNQKYQVDIGAVSSSPQGFSVALGVESVLLFTTAKEGEIVTNNLNSINLDYEVIPNRFDINITNNSDIKNKEYKLMIFNHSKTEQIYGMKVLRVGDTLASLTKGYDDIPDTEMIKLKTNQIKIKPCEKGNIVFELYIPKMKEFQNKNYQFIIYTYLKNKNENSGIHCKVSLHLH